MHKIIQKEVFLNSEGDRWYFRNKDLINRTSIIDDPLFKEILSFFPIVETKLRVLEIGCGNGKRLIELKKHGFEVSGVDPSKSAVKDAISNGINAIVGTADKLPFENNSFDIIVFGFCLYLCDRDDLFLIAAEANRVLDENGYVFIFDFYSKEAFENNYHHIDGLKSYKMDYCKLFDWHPNYILLKHTIGSHKSLEFVNDKNEWVSVSILKKI